MGTINGTYSLRKPFSQLKAIHHFFQSIPFRNFHILGNKFITICWQVSLTISHTVNLPIPNNSDSVLYSIFVTNFQIVITTISSTLIDNLRFVSFLAVKQHSSLHIIVNVVCDRHKFSFHQSLPKEPACTASHQGLLQGIHHMLRGRHSD